MKFPRRIAEMQICINCDEYKTYHCWPLWGLVCWRNGPFSISPGSRVKIYDIKDEVYMCVTHPHTESHGSPHILLPSPRRILLPWLYNTKWNIMLYQVRVLSHPNPPPLPLSLFHYSLNPITYAKMFRQSPSHRPFSQTPSVLINNAVPLP